MTIVLFLLVLVVLIVVHELGHFFAAKWAGMKVEEFGIGYPPRALTLWRTHGTEYTINWLPFGGFVKIFGEDDSVEGNKATDSFTSKSHLVQALVLVAGIAMNILFAYVLLSVALGLGMPRVIEGEEARTNPDAMLVVSHVVPGSPAADAGLQAGDIILDVTGGATPLPSKSAEDFTTLITASPEMEVTLTIERGTETKEITATPATGIIPTAPERAALGVGVATVGTVALSWWQAPIEGVAVAFDATQQIAGGLVHFFGSIFTLSADLSQVAGPVGIAGAVGDASASGIVPLLTLVAIISLNLALVNIIPLPALDGGRLLFVLIEAVTRKPIPQGFAGALNTLGFALLILLMVAITASDIFKLLG